MTPKAKSPKKRVDAELESIIEAMGRAMRNADRKYIADRAEHYGNAIPLTLNMAGALYQFEEFCRRTCGTK